jgi:putative phage-type endonuclease
MKIIDVQQGTPEWRAHRFSHRNASDAPAMMGVSPYKSRNQLLKELALGIEEEVSEFKQSLFDKGHAAEAIARSYIESQLGQDLFPVVGVSDEHPTMSASFDGLTMDSTISFECKLWNQELASCLTAPEPTLPMLYVWQLEHQALVAGSTLQKILFTVFDLDNDNGITHEYTPNPELQKHLLAGWQQFEVDLANYKHEDVPVKPIAKKVEALPALRIEVTGKVAASNFADFSKIVTQYIGDINTDLQTDENFADAESDVKWCAEVESKISFVKEQVLGQTTDIDALFRAMDDISESARQKRLSLEKLVTKQKEKIRADIIAKANADYRQYIDDCNKSLGRVTLPLIPAKFAEVIKGKRTVSSLRDAIDAELARVKIEASRQQMAIIENLRAFDDITAGENLAHLFRDLQLLIMQPAEAFGSIVKTRVTEERTRIENQRIKAAEEERQRLEAERIAAERRQAEQAKAPPASAPIISGDVFAGSEVVTPQKAVETVSVVSGAKTSMRLPSRPSDHELIGVLALHYRVHESKVVEWLLQVDLSNPALCAA